MTEWLAPKLVQFDPVENSGIIAFIEPKKIKSAVSGAICEAASCVMAGRNQ